jgi:hypothetical protein
LGAGQRPKIPIVVETSTTHWWVQQAEGIDFMQLGFVMRRLGKLIGVSFAALMLVVPAFGQERMVLGPRQFEHDQSGKGAVLCTWSIYLSVQQVTKICGLPRRTTDDAIDKAIEAIDEFIIANSSLRPNKRMIEEFKHAAEQQQLRLLRQQQKNFCANNDIEFFRKPSPEQIQESVKSLLSVPREPVMNPCL